MRAHPTPSTAEPGGITGYLAAAIFCLQSSELSTHSTAHVVTCPEVLHKFLSSCEFPFNWSSFQLLGTFSNILSTIKISAHPTNINSRLHKFIKGILGWSGTYRTLNWMCFSYPFIFISFFSSELWLPLVPNLHLKNVVPGSSIQSQQEALH